MPQFFRKKRYYRYHHNFCKKYLRIDFQYTCAYCGTNEAESIDGISAFEIDHFKPQKKFSGESEVHDYENLFYSCHICNGGKNDDWVEELLNPCTHDIFGEGFHIEEKTDEKYKLINKTDEGLTYIRTLKLNQKKQRIIRKKRALYREKVEKEIEKLKNILKRIDSNELSGSLVDEKAELENLLYSKKSELIGPYYERIKEAYFDEEVEGMFEEEFEKIIGLDSGISLLKKYEEHDLDYILETPDNTFPVYVRLEEEVAFISGSKQLRIPVSQAENWHSEKELILVMLFDRSNKKIYFENFHVYFQSNPVKTENIYTIKILESNNLESNVKDFIDIIN